MLKRCSEQSGRKANKKTNGVKEEDVRLYSEQITVCHRNKRKEHCKKIIKVCCAYGRGGGSFRKRNVMGKSVSFVTLDNFHSSHWNKTSHKINNMVALSKKITCFKFNQIIINNRNGFQKQQQKRKMPRIVIESSLKAI